MFGYDPMREEMEAEENGYYDYIYEAYGAEAKAMADMEDFIAKCEAEEQDQADMSRGYCEIHEYYFSGIPF